MFLFSSVVYLRTLLLPKEIYPRKYSLNLRQLIFFMLLSQNKLADAE